MTLLSLLLLGNAALHGVVVGRFGIKGNEPPAVFGIRIAPLGQSEQRSRRARLSWIREE